MEIYKCYQEYSTDGDCVNDFVKDEKTVRNKKYLECFG